MKRIIILASGSGSNTENIIKYFRKHEQIEVSAVLTNKNTAQVLERCKRLKVPALYFNKVAFSDTTIVLDFLVSQKPDLIVLAGFLWKIPENLVSTFPNKIVNIHPALLPKYGGKGMYGSKVHEAVKENGETETGITIHFVNEHYDEGTIIHQAKTTISPKDTAEQIAEKVHALEYGHFPKVLEKLLTSPDTKKGIDLSKGEVK